jgi:hypothetical protein
MNNCGIEVTDRMQIPIRTIALSLLLAFNATAVCARSKTPEAPPPTNPAATQQLPPLDLTLPPAVAQQSTPIDLTLPPAVTQQSAPIGLAPPSAAVPQSAATDLRSASAEVNRVARWISDSRDNGGMPYLLVDKVNAQVFAFSASGQLQGTAPALLGLAHGDRLLAPNTAAMSEMPPQVRITPAGRFVSQLAIDSHGKELLVLNYDASISMHPVVKGTPEEHRAERLASVTSQDNRISYGCINVPPAFYTTFVHPAFNQTKGIVYVLPETSPAGQLFGFSEAVPGSQQSSTVLSAGTTQTAPASGAK